jgi:uncharacterized membrane protein
LCARWERDAAVRAPAHLANRRSMSASLPEDQWQSNMASIDADIAVANTPDSATGTSLIQQRDARGQAWEKDAVAQAWPKYEAMIDRAELDSFIKKYKNFLVSSASIVDARTEDVVDWLKSSALQDGLTEYHRSCLEDGIAFEATVGTLVMGITSSPVGKSYISGLVEDAKCNNNNLIWRAIAFNQQDASTELDHALSFITTTKKNFTVEALGTAEDCMKYLAKLGQLVSKAHSLHNALVKPGMIQLPTGGLEKILLTVGQLFVRPFINKGIDMLAGWLVHGLILVRSGSNYKKVVDFLVAEAKFSKFDRADTLLLLAVGKGIAKAEQHASRIKLNGVWNALAEDADKPYPKNHEKLPGGFNEAREIRFSIVAVMLQLAYVAKLRNDLGNSPHDKKIRAELWAAGMSLAAGISDIGALAIKIVDPLKDLALSYQGLKISGGLFSVGSAWINVENDIVNAKKSGIDGGQDIAWLYYTKAFSNGAVGFFSAINSLSYTRPVLEMLAHKFPLSVFGRAAASLVRTGAALAGRLVIARAILIFCGMEFTVAIFALEFIIWKFSDDELQKWCKNCAFGKIKQNRTLSANSQKTAFDAALMEVL